MHYLLGFLLEFLDGTLVDSTALVDQMAGGGRLARVDVADDDNVDVELLLGHVDAVLRCGFERKKLKGFDDYDELKLKQRKM